MNDAEKTRKNIDDDGENDKSRDRTRISKPRRFRALFERNRPIRIRKTSRFGACRGSEDGLKGRKISTNQKKPRQGLTRQDMRKEHRRWCVACQTLLKKEEALSVTKVLNVDVV